MGKIARDAASVADAMTANRYAPFRDALIEVRDPYMRARWRADSRGVHLRYRKQAKRKMPRIQSSSSLQLTLIALVLPGNGEEHYSSEKCELVASFASARAASDSEKGG